MAGIFGYPSGRGNTLRKADLELLDVHLEPLRTTRDRHEAEIKTLERDGKSLSEQLANHLRDADANDLAIKQALATVRSLIQRAHRLSKEELGEEEEEPTVAVDNEPQPMNVRAYRDSVIRKARARSGRSALL